MKSESITRYRTGPVFVAACIGMCFFGISMIVLGAVLPQLSAKFGMTGAQTTGIVTSLPIGILVGSLVFGPVVDRFGHKMPLNISCLLVLAGVAALAAAQSPGMLAAAIPAIGFGGGILNGETNALVAEIYDGRSRSSHLSILGVFYGLGALTIPTLLNMLSHHFAFEVILGSLAVLMAAGLVYCLCVRYPEPKQPQGFPLREMARVISDPVLLMLSFVLFFQSGVESITNNWTTSYVEHAGYDMSVGLNALTWMLVGMTLARLLQAYAFKVINPLHILPASLVCAAAGFVLLWWSPAPWATGGAMFVAGAGLASTFPVVFGILGEKFASLSGTAMSVALVIALCGQTALNYTTGALAARSGGIGLFPLLAAGSVVAMIVIFGLWRLRRHK